MAKEEILYVSREILDQLVMGYAEDLGFNPRSCKPEYDFDIHSGEMYGLEGYQVVLDKAK